MTPANTNGWFIVCNRNDVTEVYHAEWRDDKGKVLKIDCINLDAAFILVETLNNASDYSEPRYDY